MGEQQSLRDVLAGDPLLLTAEEAADMLRVGRTTVFALMKAGALRPVHIGRSCRISRAELERYVRRLEAPQPVPSRRQAQQRMTTNQAGLFELASDPVNARDLCILGPGCRIRAQHSKPVEDHHRRERSMTDAEERTRTTP